MSWQSELSKIIKGKLSFKEPLYKHTTWKVGGCADVLAEPLDLSDLKRLIKFSKNKKLPLFVIGAGSNLLISDKGIKGIVVKFSNPYFKKIEFRKNYCFAASGAGLNSLVNSALAKGLSGGEFLSGIPGTLGGALAMNAGVRNIFSKNKNYLSISDLVEEINVIDFNARKKLLKKKDVRFEYRNSDLSKFIIISARLKFSPKDKKEISALSQEFLNYKRDIQDVKSRSAGCVFKNPNDNSDNGSLTAGKMIDACGLKGKGYGGAEVSRIHANFILNRREAKAADIFHLMRLVQKMVKQKFNVSLEPEVKIIGKF